MKILVSQELAQYADDFARRLTAYRTGSPHRNNLESGDWDEWMRLIGTRAEAGLYYFFGGKRAGAKWDTGIGKAAGQHRPDIIYKGHSYDAKGIDRRGLSLCVYKGGVETEWRYVLVNVVAWPEVDLRGWCTGADILMTALRERVKDRPAYFIEETLLHDCGELMGI
jgi:hypothetical protein